MILQGVVSLLLVAAPIRSATDAVVQLKSGKKEAVARVTKACRGKLRHSLRDHKAIFGQLFRLAKSGSVEVKKAVLDTAPCFSKGQFQKILVPRLKDGDPAVVAYAAEAAARLEEPALVAELLQALAQRKKACLAEGLAKPDLDVCVWLTYAPGAALIGADRATRKRAAEAAVGMFESPYPKVREVAVETVNAAKLRVYADRVTELITWEKKKKFKKSNDAALIGRFKKRARALRKGDQ